MLAAGRAARPVDGGPPACYRTSRALALRRVEYPSMIGRIYVDNFRRMVNFDLRLTEFTLLLGANGAGKSSVLDVVFGLREFLAGTAKVLDVFPSSSRTRWQDRAIQVFELDGALAAEPFEYRLEVEHEPARRRARVKTERLTTGGKPLFAFVQGEVQLYRDDHVAGPNFPASTAESALARVIPGKDNQRLTRFLEFMRRVLVCGFYPRAFAPESASEDSGLQRDGANFASWYRHMVQEHPDAAHAYVETLREIVEGFRNIRLERVGSEARAFMLAFGEGKSRYELRLDELSDGQRALLALNALTQLTASEDYALFIDEPDNYLALAEIQPWLTGLADRCGSDVCQAILCSHHPEVIDYVGADRGILLEQEVSGVIKVRPLAEAVPDGGAKLSEVIARGWER